MMAGPETNYPAARFGVDPEKEDGNVPSDAEVSQETPTAQVGAVVTIEFLDSNTFTQFLITHQEREREELSFKLQTQLPPEIKLARANAPLARAVMGKPAGDEILELVVQRTRPLKIIEVKMLTS